MRIKMNRATIRWLKGLTICLASCWLFPPVAYAVGCKIDNQQVTIDNLQNCVDSKKLQVTINQPIVDRINLIRNARDEQILMQEALLRMKKYEPVIVKQLKEMHMPLFLLALPMVESGYRPLDQSINPMKAAGIWQLTPDTAGRYGLVLNEHQDDRLNTVLSTQAALNYLQTLYFEFKDWHLAVMAYEIGMNRTNDLVKIAKSKDSWVIVQSFTTYRQLRAVQLKQFFVMFDAAAIIISHPDLIQSKNDV